MKRLIIAILFFLVLPSRAGVDGTNTQYIAAGAVSELHSATKATLAGWIRRDSAGTFQQLGPSNLTATNKLLFDWYSDNVMYFEVSNGTNAYGFISANLTGWHHFCMVYDGTQATNATKLVCYLNGAVQSLTFAGTIPTSLPVSGLNMYVNQSVWAIGVGGYAECGIWDNTLTASEVASLAKGFSPDQIRPQSLIFYMPLTSLLNNVVGPAAINVGMTASPHPLIRQ